MRFVILALSFLFAVPATAQNFWIPADKFREHTNVALEGAFDIDGDTGMPIRLLGDGQQVRIQIGKNASLSQYLREYNVFQVCALVANYGSGITNRVRSKHPDPLKTQTHTLSNTSYKTVCSARAPIDTSKLQTAGIRVFPPSQGIIKVRGVLFRGINTQAPTANNSRLADYEYSRALGYMWGDGGVSDNGDSLYFRKSTSRTSRHLASVASSYFGNAFRENSQGSRYLVELDGITPERFLVKGLRLSKIPNKKAFLTSVVETEGAVLQGRLADDPNPMRCEFLKTLVDGLNPRCSATTCTDASCTTPNCAVIASGKSRGKPYRPGKNCAVYLSGSSGNWRSLFSSNGYHFVKTDRTPGGEPTEHSPESRPSYATNRN